MARPAGLSRRIALTSVGLVLVYAALVATLVLSGVFGLIVAGIAVVVVGLQVRASDRMLLKLLKAHAVTPEQQPALWGSVDRLCLQADLPRPRVMVCDTGVPNALAVGGLGRTPTVCVDRRLLTLLEPAELEGVVAHELAHVAHRDVTVMTIASFFALVAAVLTKIAIHGGHAAIRGVALLAAPIAWGLATLLLRALSRYRELAADRTAATLTGRPSALASALLKVDTAIAGIPTKDLRALHPAAALAFSPLPRGRWERLLATHPTTARRVAELQAVERTR